MYAQNISLAKDEVELEARQKEFAAHLLRMPDDPFKAALAVFGDADPGRALYAAQNWVRHPIVLAHMETLKQEHGALYFLPDKATVCRKVWDIAETAKTVAEKTNAIKLYSDLMGFNPKPESNSSQNVFVGGGNGGARVMVVTKHGDDNDWKEAARVQQAKLLESAAEDLAESPSHAAE